MFAGVLSAPATRRGVTAKQAEKEDWYRPNEMGGKCMCGCGADAPLAKKTVKRQGHIKGQPLRFLRGHGGVGRPTHGHTIGGKPSPTYQAWIGMVQRCTYPRHRRYVDFGGRGITVDPSWLGPGGFERFLSEMGERPEGTSIDRIDPDGSYFRENCRWTDAKTQRANQRPRKATALAGEVT